MKKKSYIYNKSFDRIKANIEDTTYGLCPAPLPAQEALFILKDYLLGDTWYHTLACSQEQENAIIVEQILDKHAKQWQKDWKNYEKGT
jgi:hypothetical protein